MRICVAADPGKFCEQVSDLLREQGHEVVSIAKPARAFEELLQARADLLVVVKPFFNAAFGAFLKRVRADAKLRPTPVLCVDPKGTPDAGVSYLDSGADDFINRPFNPQIFLARVRTLLRRRVWAGELDEAPAVTALQVGQISVQLLQRQVSVAGQPLLLTRLEFDLLAFFLRHPDHVLKREEILAAVWNYPGNVETRTLDKHVEMLRRKLGAQGAQIETVHGVGYRLGAPKRATR